jgi:diguanylate cyclase (GGDEF)-like protein
LPTYQTLAQLDFKNQFMLANPTYSRSDALEDKWRSIISNHIDYAFEPIVNIHTGVTFGFEALLRRYSEVGFSSIAEFFDTAYNESMLYHVELSLREKAVEKFARTGLQERTKLFLNVDNRIVEMPNYRQGNTTKLLTRYGLTPSQICFEISEQHRFTTSELSRQILHFTRSQSYKIALDDFGVGFSGLQLLYYAQADFLKIDRFFIDGMAMDSRKRFFVSSIVNMAHLLGIMVIAEGIETEQEFFLCRDLGCDLAQGYLIQKPTLDGSELCLKYDIIEILVRKDRRKPSHDQSLITSQIEFITQVSVKSSMDEVFDLFQQNNDYNFFPVTTERNEPLGIVREKDLKSYIYSMYGRQLLKNKSVGKTLKDFVVKCPVIDINIKAEKMLEIFAVEENAEGIIVVDDMQYVGFLTAKALLRVLNEKNLITARDQNPLTKLAGNSLIYAFIAEALSAADTTHVFVYFDLDNFKPYNDKYGFRKGDHVIISFAELLKKNFSEETCFIGHVGGDDFFLGTAAMDYEDLHAKLTATIDAFTESVKMFYDMPDVEALGITAKDRDGNVKKFPLLTVTAAALVLNEKKREVAMEDITAILANLKKSAKGLSGIVSAASVI